MECREVHELLSALALGELAGEEAAPARAHVASCDECRELLARLEALDLAAGLLVAPRPDAGASARMLGGLRRRLAGEEGLPGGEVWTPEEVARFLKVPPEAVYAMASELPFFWFGEHLRIRKEQLLAWVAASEERARVAPLRRVGRRH